MSENLITLRSVASFGSVTVDHENGIIRNVAILSRGPAVGHGFEVDDVMLNQTLSALKSAGNVRSHLTHAHAQGGMFAAPPDGITSEVGHVVGSSARIDNGVVRGDVQLSKASENQPGLGNVRQYILDKAAESPDTFGLSIVFPKKLEAVNGITYGRVESLHAVDFVGDPGANRMGLLSSGDLPMSTTTTPTEAEVSLAKIEADTKTFTQLAKVARLDEQGIDAFVVKHLSAGSTVEAAKADSLELLKAHLSPVTLNTRCDVYQTGSGAARLVSDMEAGMALKFGLKQVAKFDHNGAICLSAPGKLEYAPVSPHGAKFGEMPVREFARLWLQAAGVDTYGLSMTEMVNRAWTEKVSLAQSTSDFAHVLGNTVGRSLRQAYAEAPKTWPTWARSATAPDFKSFKRVALSTAPALVETNEGAGIPYSYMTDGAETYALAEYQSGLRLTRRAIINDDLNAFQRLPMLQSSAAIRREEDVAYAALLGTVAMSDGQVVFHSTHSNLYEGSGTLELTVAGLSVAIAAMARQTSLGGAILDLMPETLLVAPEDLTTALQLTSSMLSATTVEAIVPNTIKNLQVVSTSRLEEGEWILSANRGQIDTAEVCFLEGEQTPQLRQEIDFDTEDLKLAVRHTVAAKVIDHRGFYGANLE